MTARMTKAQKMFHVSACILVLEMRKSSLTWKVTDLVKKSKVSRSMIYQYFGSDKEHMLEQAIDIFVSQFYGFEDVPKGQTLATMVGRARQYVIDFPESALLY